jgi:hypothetical protein
VLAALLHKPARDKQNAYHALRLAHRGFVNGCGSALEKAADPKPQLAGLTFSIHFKWIDRLAAFNGGI